MRVAAMAAGAVGGYFGARLAAAGHDVSFIARGALLEAIRTKGLKIESPLGDLHLHDRPVLEHAEDAKCGKAGQHDGNADHDQRSVSAIHRLSSSGYRSIPPGA